MLSVISSREKPFQISDKWIQPLDLNVWHEMDEFRVMLVDANHAPGAVMLIIESDRRNALGRILYTGSFRADARFYENLMGLSALQEVVFTHYSSVNKVPYMAFELHYLNNVFPKA